MQVPPRSGIAFIIREWCASHNRDLDYRLPDGSHVPLDFEELDEILAGITLSGRFYAAELAVGMGAANAYGLERRQPGPRPIKCARVLEEIKAGLERDPPEFTLEDILAPGTRDSWEIRFKACHHTIKRAVEQLRAQGYA